MGRKRRQITQEKREFRAMVKAIVDSMRLRCQFVLQKGDRQGKMCGRVAKKSDIIGVGALKANLCWHHRKYIAKHKKADIVEIES